MRRYAFALIYLMMISSTAYADFEQGRDAFLRDDYQVAWKELKPLADAGNANALHWIGTFYAHGKLVHQDSKVALHYYRAAAEKGYKQAQFLTGFMLYHGMGTENDLPDFGNAARWLSIAAENGNAMAQYLWGNTLYFGLSGDRKIAEGLKWYRMAALAGSVVVSVISIPQNCRAPRMRESRKQRKSAYAKNLVNRDRDRAAVEK